MKKYDVAIIDGNNIFYKAFSVHQLSVRINDETIQTGGTFGFINSLLTLKRDYLKNNSKILITWDKGHARRSLIYPEYKSNRNKDEWEQRENFESQMKYLQYVLNIMGITQVFKAGEEADDICGTLSKRQAEAGNEVILVSADKDFQQLLGHSIDLLANKGKNNTTLWNVDSWTKNRGYSPKYFSYFLALNGDTGDNIPGIKGIGEKTADKFIIENFDLIDCMINDLSYEHAIPENKSAAVIKLLSGVSNLKLSYKLAIIDRDVKGMIVQKYNRNMVRLEEIFEALKFKYFLEDKNWNALGEL
jgi:DNA polymerase-1